MNLFLLLLIQSSVHSSVPRILIVLLNIFQSLRSPANGQRAAPLYALHVISAHVKVCYCIQSPELYGSTIISLCRFLLGAYINNIINFYKRNSYIYIYISHFQINMKFKTIYISLTESSQVEVFVPCNSSNPCLPSSMLVVSVTKPKNKLYN